MAKLPDSKELAEELFDRVWPVVEKSIVEAEGWQSVAQETFQLLGLAPAEETPEAYRRALQEWAQKGRNAGIKEWGMEK